MIHGQIVTVLGYKFFIAEMSYAPNYYKTLHTAP